MTDLSIGDDGLANGVAQGIPVAADKTISILAGCPSTLRVNKHDPHPKAIGETAERIGMVQRHVTSRPYC